MDNKSESLVHYGVKGMKWGVRRYQNKDGTLTEKGVKRYAKKGYAQDSYESNKTALGKAFDLYTRAHERQADVQYNRSTKAQNRERAARYLADRDQKRNQKNIDKVVAKYAKKGYAQDPYESNKTVLGKVYDLYTGAHKIDANLKYKTASNDDNLKRAKAYLGNRGEILEERLSKIKKYKR